MDASGAAQAFAPPAELQAGYDAGLGGGAGGAQAFNQALQSAESAASSPATAPGGLDSLQPAMKGMMDTLEHVNGEATQLAQIADAARRRAPRSSPAKWS